MSEPCRQALNFRINEVLVLSEILNESEHDWVAGHALKINGMCNVHKREVHAQ
jgi:hypothetical protein